MNKQPYDITVRITATPEQANELAQRMQAVVNLVDSETLVKMFKVLEKNPSWIKKAILAVKFM